MEDAYLDPRDPSFIADLRDPPTLAKSTICGQRLQADADLLFARVLENNMYAASVVCADLVASFHWQRAWHALLDVYMKHVHVENALFLPVRFVDCARLFVRLEAESRFSMHNVRNHYELRLRFAELAVVLCHARKRSAQVTSFSFAKGASVTATTVAGRSSGVSPFHPSVMQQYTKATDTLRADALLGDLGLLLDDEKEDSPGEHGKEGGSFSSVSRSAASVPVLELDGGGGGSTPAGYMSAFYLCLNEFMFALENTELRTEHFVLYWIQCMLELHQKRARKAAEFRPLLRSGGGGGGGAAVGGSGSGGGGEGGFGSVTGRLGVFLGDRSIFAAGEDSGGGRGATGQGRKRRRRGGWLSASAAAATAVPPHIAWVIWLVCVRYMERQGAAAKGDVHWPKVRMAVRELLALFEFEFPMTPTCMMRYFGMLLDLLMQRQLCRFPASVVEVMRDTQTAALPPMHHFATQPYMQVKKQEVGGSGSGGMRLRFEDSQK